MRSSSSTDKRFPNGQQILHPREKENQQREMHSLACPFRKPTYSNGCLYFTGFLHPISSYVVLCTHICTCSSMICLFVIFPFYLDLFRGGVSGLSLQGRDVDCDTGG